MRLKKTKEARNLLVLCPQRKRASESSAEGREVVLVPRHGNSWLGRWLAGRARNPYQRIHLDEYGTFVWRRLDGATAVQAIAEAMRQTYGDKVEPAYQRVGMFVNQLARQGLISIPNEKE